MGVGKNNQSVVENVNSVSQTSASTLTLSEKGQQIEEKILRGESLSASDLEGFSTPELRILRNVHFARYGRKYDKGGLGDYFFTRPWYKPRDDYNESMITSNDKGNVNLILAAENTAKNENVTSANSSNLTNVSVVNSSISQTVSTPQSTNDLNRQTILTLVSGRIDRPVAVLMRNEAWAIEGTRYAIYGQMIKEKIISCEWISQPDRWIKCVPGPKGTSFRQFDWGTYELIIGKMFPTEISGISRINDTSAFADVVLSFESNSNYELYNRFRSIFKENPNTGNRIQRIMLRLYDDGWRVEKDNF